MTFLVAYQCSSLAIAACVPLPAPGGPKKMVCFFGLSSQFRRRPNSLIKSTVATDANFAAILLTLTLKVRAKSLNPSRQL